MKSNTEIALELQQEIDSLTEELTAKKLAFEFFKNYLPKPPRVTYPRCSRCNDVGLIGDGDGTRYCQCTFYGKNPHNRATKPS